MSKKLRNRHPERASIVHALERQTISPRLHTRELTVSEDSFTATQKRIIDEWIIKLIDQAGSFLSERHVLEHSLKFPTKLRPFCWLAIYWK